MKKVLPLALVFIAGLFVIPKLLKGSAISTLRYILTGINFKFSGLIPYITLTIAVQNTSNQAITINSISGDLFINGEKTAAISNFQKFVIEGNSEQDITITARLDLTEIISQVIDIFSGRIKASADIRFSGYVNAENLQLPIDLTYKLIPESLLI